MTKTHYLVPVDAYDSETFDMLMRAHPAIDLSEDSIAKMARKAETKNMDLVGDPLQYQDGYQQCAKDLLNSK